MRVVPRIIPIIRPGIQITVSRDFFAGNCRGTGHSLKAALWGRREEKKWM